jgi:hypothetical protein
VEKKITHFTEVDGREYKALHKLSFVRSFLDWMKDFHDLLSQRLEWSPLCFASLMICSMYLELVEMLLVFLCQVGAVHRLDRTEDFN